MARGRRYRGVEPPRDERGLVSDGEWRRPGTRYGLRLLHVLMLVFLLIVGLGPILWLAKSAITPTQDTLRTPMALFPSGVDLENLSAVYFRLTRSWAS